MPTPQTTTKLKTLLSSNLFVSQKTKKDLLNKIDLFTPEQIQETISILENAQTKQTLMFAKIVENNPNFLADLKQFTYKQIRNINQKAEDKIKTEEYDILHNIEQELDQI